MAEFAVAATVFFMIFFALMEIGMAVLTSDALSEAAREATRYAMVHSSTSYDPATTAQIQQVAVNAVSNLNLSTGDVVVSWPSDPNYTGKTDIQVVVSYSYPLHVPFVSSITLPLSSTSRVLVAQ